MDQSVKEEVKKILSSKEEQTAASAETRKSTLMGSINYGRAFSHNMQGPTPPVPDLTAFPAVEEVLRVTDEFCDQYRVLRMEVEILQEENNDCSGKRRNCSGLYYQCKTMDRGS